jgi:DNA-binding beta-propeller fold protein YncE
MKAAILSALGAIICLGCLCLTACQEPVVPDPQPGALVYQGRVGDAGDETLLGVSFAAVSPDGRHVYVAASKANAIAMFSRNADTGALDYRGRVGHAGALILHGVTSVALSPDGAHAYATCPMNYAVYWFTREAASGELYFQGSYGDAGNPVIKGATAVVISPDGKHAYVAADGDPDGVVAWFTRDAATGALAYGGRYSNPVFNGAQFVTIAPDGNHAYVAANLANAVAWFTRDTGSGALTYGGRFGGGTDPTLKGAVSVIISSDGRHAYATAAGSSNVAWFSRDAGTGELIFQGSFGGESSGYLISMTSSIALSPDGRYAFVTGSPQTAAWFSRDAQTGGLTYGGRFSGDSFTDRMLEPLSIAVAPDGKNAYVAAAVSNAVAWFDIIQ